MRRSGSSFIIRIMDPIWIAAAFILGFIVRSLGLPPLVGYLAAGFILKSFGAEAGELVNTLSDIGIMLLLFTIGIKMRLKTLFRPGLLGED